MKKSIQTKPRARRADLIVQELTDETLVYDTISHKAHCLNPTAALIWNRCNGTRTVSQIKDIVAKESGGPVDESLVWLALKQLDKSRLLHESVSSPLANTLTRRDVMKRIGIGAITLPVITTILAPTASAAGSCTADEGRCCDQTVSPIRFLGCCPNLSCRRLMPQDQFCVCKPGASENCTMGPCLAGNFTRSPGRSGRTR